MVTTPQVGGSVLALGEMKSVGTQESAWLRTGPWVPCAPAFPSGLFVST